MQVVEAVNLEMEEKENVRIGAWKAFQKLNGLTCGTSWMTCTGLWKLMGWSELIELVDCGVTKMVWLLGKR